MGPTWGRQVPGGPHVGPMILAIEDNNQGIADPPISLEQCLWFLVPCARIWINNQHKLSLSIDYHVDECVARGGRVSTLGSYGLNL